MPTMCDRASMLRRCVLMVCPARCSGRTTCIVSRRCEQCCGAEIDVIVVYRRCAASVRSCHALFRL